MAQQTEDIRVGVDIGGTFTDVVAVGGDARIRLLKIPTTRSDESAAVITALSVMRREWGIEPSHITRFVHGTTVATNAVLERKGAKTGLLTTEGFRDTLEIGREFRRSMYDLVLKPHTPVFLVPGARRMGVRERTSGTGEVIVPIDERSVRDAVSELVAQNVEAIAICFLFSFLNPRHELRARDIIREMAPGLSVSLSHEVDPAFREYERTCATAFDAYIKPVVGGYLETMEKDLSRAGVNAALHIMQSRGGITSSRLGRERPVRLFLSGPAAGVIGGVAAGREAGFDNLVTIDIGGTSCDIALVKDGQPLVRPDGVIDGFTIRSPMIDVNAIGSGGGSIVWIDKAGGLKVGPRSAGSEPGPACYGRGGTEPTVTDASLVLGYINPAYFAGGALQLDVAAARQAVATTASALDWAIEQTALGIHRVVNAQMAEGIRMVSIRRGIDPRQFTLVAMGGAGPLHATALAGELGMSRVVVPPYPGVLSAAGLLAAELEHEKSAAFHRDLVDLQWSDVRSVLDDLDRHTAEVMALEGLVTRDMLRSHLADVCYIGQSYHLEIRIVEEDPEPLRRLYQDFLETHARIYGHSVERPAQIVNLRTVHRSQRMATSLPAAVRTTGCTASKGKRGILVSWTRQPVSATIWARAALKEGTVIDGPAIIEQPDTTTLIEPGWRADVLPNGSLVLNRV